MGISRRAALFGGLAGGLGAVFGGIARAGNLSYEYDALGRLTKVTYPDGAYVTYTYDAAGNRTQRRQVPWGSTFTATIQITGTGPVNLRDLADIAGYNGFDAIITFEVGNGVTIMGEPGAAGASSEDGGQGGVGITTGTWPTGKSIDLTLNINSGAVVLGGGGGGGGGAGGDYTSYSIYSGAGGGDEIPGQGGAGGVAISCSVPMTINVMSGGLVALGGDGGAGGIAYEEVIIPWMGDYGYYAGGGGGGGFPNGSGGSGGFGVPYPGYYYIGDSGTPGGEGTISVGGVGGSSGYGSGHPSSAHHASNGFAPGIGAGYYGYYGYHPGYGYGYVIVKNGHAVTVSNSGTITGSIV